MGSRTEGIEASAASIAEELRSSGYRLDFTIATLHELDRFIDDQTRRGKPKRRGLLANDDGTRLVALGAYLGEVLRRHTGGGWVVDEDDQGGKMDVGLQLPDGTVCWPMQRVLKRVMNGAEDGIAAYALMLAERPESAPGCASLPTSAEVGGDAYEGRAPSALGDAYDRPGVPWLDSIASELDAYAKVVAFMLRLDSYDLDFTVETVGEIDRYIAASCKRGKPKRGSALRKQTSAMLCVLGAYVGEVVRRYTNATWVADDPRGVFDAKLQLPDGSICEPMQRVRDRVANGAEDDVASYARALIQQSIGSPTERKEPIIVKEVVGAWPPV